MSTIFSVGYWSFAAVTSAFLYLGAVLIWSLTMPFDPTRSRLHRYTCWWGQLYLQ
jgi:1-acyl-sn-glycerol-3-phosphate acyltransferase